MKLNKKLIKREIAGDVLLVPIGKSVYDSNGLFVLNEVAAFIWNHLAEAESEEQIVSLLLEEYDVTKEEAEADVHAFLNKLKEMQIL